MRAVCRPDARTSTRGQRAERFGRRDRLLRRADFQRCYREGRREHGAAAVLHASPTTGPAGEEGPRLGITATRKVGGAVVRNRLRRRVREAFRRSPERLRLRGLDLVVHLRPQAAELAHDEMRTDVEELLRRMADRWASAGRGA